jgi:hypothetical protein
MAEAGPLDSHAVCHLGGADGRANTVRQGLILDGLPPPNSRRRAIGDGQSRGHARQGGAAGAGVGSLRPGFALHGSFEGERRMGCETEGVLLVTRWRWANAL